MFVKSGLKIGRFTEYWFLFDFMKILWKTTYACINIFCKIFLFRIFSGDFFSNRSVFREIEIFGESSIRTVNPPKMLISRNTFRFLFIYVVCDSEERFFLVTCFIYKLVIFFFVRIWLIHLNFVTLRELWSWFLRAGIRYTGWDPWFPCP